MAVLRRTLILASALACLASAQTIKKNGRVVAADETTVPIAAENVQSELVLTDSVLAQLSSQELSNVSLFDFADDVEATENDKRSRFTGCKTFPGDKLWPLKIVWKVFDLVTGGALIKTVPVGAVCYTNSEHYDADKCQNILDHWTESATHANDPTSIMSPLFQGKTCMPQNGDDGTCELGGFPSYAVNISTVAQIQLAINFARNTNIRLIIKNTGHDFLGKSAGAGALSIWTHNLKSIDFIEHYEGCGYSGPAMKLGAGVEVGELYAAADKYGVSAVGGECKGVGVTGGYIQGGGHSPLSSIYGMGADQVLSIDIVLPNGRFITADKKNHPDIFWAVRGGGGGTFGVVTSMTVKVHPKSVYSGLTFFVTSGNDSLANVTTEAFIAGLEAYWRRFPDYAPVEGHYGYSSVYPRFDGIPGYTWQFHPWLAPNTKLADFKKTVAPLLAEWEEVGFNVEPEFFEYDNFLTPWKEHFPVESVANADLRTGSRLIPAKNWEDPVLLNQTFAVLEEVMQGSALIMYNIVGKKQRNVHNAVNPAWRDNLFYVIVGSSWTDDSTSAEIEAANKAITYTTLEKLRSVSKGAGSYLNEADIAEPDFQQAFWGTNYDRLLKIKKEVDPWDTFWAPTAVGSEGWYITRQEPWLQTQNGRLCRK
ncbi:putative 6-hydroxy-D-nicotine oxidase [Xylaria bambusicola]|uniref:putative 6-hydroxy-D-nicotine oxidase n=1 Tax=Xylaria bambusicola TaxID=326684 RepID=UPI002007A4AA|nr:putative 6-hydroxy-D-nicotine oxidase [Xylaria bambusicola]KAI0526513.1 putative 6-hydroxy-D-nicotine oxidase [Xylaria bambusicola]